jgi:hypothetical protein
MRHMCQWTSVFRHHDIISFPHCVETVFSGLGPGADRQDVVEPPIIGLFESISGCEEFLYPQEHGQSILPVMRARPRWGSRWIDRSVSRPTEYFLGTPTIGTY